MLNFRDFKGIRIIVYCLTDKHDHTEIRPIRFSVIRDVVALNLT